LDRLGRVCRLKEGGGVRERGVGVTLAGRAVLAKFLEIF
jgi:hypothetical protein